MDTGTRCLMAAKMCRWVAMVEVRVVGWWWKGSGKNLEFSGSSSSTNAAGTKDSLGHVNIQPTPPIEPQHR